MINFAMDQEDPLLGFAVDWVNELSNHFEEVIVLTDRIGKYEVRDNVRVASFGASSKFVKLLKLNWLVLSLLSSFDCVFVHMAHRFLFACLPLLVLARKPIFLWYAHRSVDPFLPVVAKFTDVVFTSVKSSFRVKHPKIVYLGHGINVSRFPYRERRNDGKMVFAMIGRIAPIKRQDLFIKALSRISLPSRRKIRVQFIGPVLEGDQDYRSMLDNMIIKAGLKEVVSFDPPFSPERAGEVYSEVDCLVNLSPTGAMDKVVLEAMASGALVLVTNSGFRGVVDERFLVEEDPENIAKVVEWILHLSEEEILSFSRRNRRVVSERFSLERTINTIARTIKEGIWSSTTL